MDKKRILIDCDTGTDDAIAIIAALYAKNADVCAITTVTGNVSVKYTSKNTLNLTRCLDFDVPVARGAWGPLKLHTDEAFAESVHGTTGMGDIVLPESSDSLYEKSAIDTIYDEAVKANGELEIVAIGPMTNLAIALLMYPELKTLVKHIWFMGGSIYGGNITPTAEFNIWCDPEAARAVLRSGIPCTMIGLDVTEKAELSVEDIDKMRALGTKAGDIIADILDFMKRRHEAGEESLIMHDALAMAAALSADCLEYEDYCVDVECEGTYTYGNTAVDLYHESGLEPNVSVAVKLDFEKFQNWLHQTVGNSAL